jgi:hypothetical protein
MACESKVGGMERPSGFRALRLGPTRFPLRLPLTQCRAQGCPLSNANQRRPFFREGSGTKRPWRHSIGSMQRELQLVSCAECARRRWGSRESTPSVSREGWAETHLAQAFESELRNAFTERVGSGSEYSPGRAFVARTSAEAE